MPSNPFRHIRQVYRFMIFPYVAQHHSRNSPFKILPLRALLSLRLKSQKQETRIERGEKRTVLTGIGRIVNTTQRCCTTICNFHDLALANSTFNYQNSFVIHSATFFKILPKILGKIGIFGAKMQIVRNTTTKGKILIFPPGEGENRKMTDIKND